MKISPNYQDSNRIKELYAEGCSFDVISRKVNVKADAVERHIVSSGLAKAVEPELTPQQRGAITRKENAAKAAFDNLSAADPEEPSIMELDSADQES
jgi:hypothetical protein